MNGIPSQVTIRLASRGFARAAGIGSDRGSDNRHNNSAGTWPMARTALRRWTSTCPHIRGTRRSF